MDNLERNLFLIMTTWTENTSIYSLSEEEFLEIERRYLDRKESDLDTSSKEQSEK